jgi:hypothetical protein
MRCGMSSLLFEPRLRAWKNHGGGARQGINNVQAGEGEVSQIVVRTIRATAGESSSLRTGKLASADLDE